MSAKPYEPMNTSDPSGMAERMTWAALLGNWIEFAKSSVALPDDAAGNAMRDSVSDIITLQAVWFALQHLDELDSDEQALGIDRAEVLIERHSSAIHDRWQNETMPAELARLIEDVHAALAKSQP